MPALIIIRDFQTCPNPASDLLYCFAAVQVVVPLAVRAVTATASAAAYSVVVQC